MAPFDPQSRIASLERELAWANLKIQSLMEELRQFRVKLLGPKSETLNDLQLQLLADQEPGTTLDEVEAESARAPLTKAPTPARKPHPGRQRAVGVREAIGEGTLSLARRDRRQLRGDASGRVGDAAQWAGCGRGATTQELVTAASGGIEHFGPVMFRNCSQLVVV